MSGPKYKPRSPKDKRLSVSQHRDAKSKVARYLEARYGIQGAPYVAFDREQLVPSDPDFNGHPALAFRGQIVEVYSYGWRVSPWHLKQLRRAAKQRERGGSRMDVNIPVQIHRMVNWMARQAP